ncbi:MAG: hypothetical protein ABJ205_01145 [Erythrobacter sp.]|uniref:hypothetical protein n=1 Tax=Erythrobacter sp. TaxID=1042 RepID=UPI0032665CBD
MTPPSTDILPPEIQLALAYASSDYRDALRIFFDLDLRLARIVAGTNEPMLGQMRLTWWRETLAKPIDERPNGDAVLEAIGQCWAGREGYLIKLVEGWERLLAEPPLREDDALFFLEGRRDTLMAAFDKYAGPEAKHGTYAQPAWWWTCADVAANITDDTERAMFVELGLRHEPIIDRLPKPDRGLAVLGAIAHRALKNGGRPLMEGRGASVTAIRAAIFRR